VALPAIIGERICYKEAAGVTGAGPRHLTLHPNGKFAYLITETTATIGAYAVDPASYLQ
jgi:6-phosphogluconolactonase (cycloisomerase 2 family)